MYFVAFFFFAFLIYYGIDWSKIYINIFTYDGNKQKLLKKLDKFEKLNETELSKLENQLRKNTGSLDAKIISL